MDDKLIDKITNLVKDKCSRVPHNIGLDVLNLVNKHQEQLTLSVVSESFETVEVDKDLVKSMNTLEKSDK